MAFDLDDDELEATRKMHKGSNINVGSIEEDIKILKSIIKVHNDFLPESNKETINEKEIKALNNLINDYTRQKQINEEHQKINGELREKVKELEEGNIQKDLEIIGTKEYAEANMKEIIEKYYTANEDCILKQKVKQGLEDIEDYFDRLNGPDEDIEYIRHVKQEILEGESK